MLEHAGTYTEDLPPCFQGEMASYAYLEHRPIAKAIIKQCTDEQIVGEADGEFCSLTDADAAHYAEEFAQPLPSHSGPDEPTQWTFYVF